jgi:predicted DNA-binding protein (MmcQ/YjbR family)
MVHTNHHRDGRFAIWCAAPDGMQQLLVDGAADRYFVPPYVGHRGWLGVHLDRDIDWEEIAGILEDAYLEIAPPKLAAQALNAVSRDPGGPS